MRILIDSADLTEIKQILKYNIISGITTNPSLVSKTFKDKGRASFLDFLAEFSANSDSEEVAQCSDIDVFLKKHDAKPSYKNKDNNNVLTNKLSDLEISVQVTETEYFKILKQGKRILGMYEDYAQRNSEIHLYQEYNNDLEGSLVQVNSNDLEEASLLRYQHNLEESLDYGLSNNSEKSLPRESHRCSEKSLEYGYSENSKYSLEHYLGINSEKQCIISKIPKNIVLKLPLTRDGIRACEYFARLGKKTNITLCFTASQALIAASAGATYVSVFLGRTEDNFDGGIEEKALSSKKLIEDTKKIFDNYKFQTKILGASIRSLNHINICSVAGIDAITISPKLFYQMIDNEFSIAGAENFVNLWKESDLIL